MDTFWVIVFGFWVIVIIGALWRPFKAAALLMEAKARYWNAVATQEERKIK
jgi:hypothetical protein